MTDPMTSAERPTQEVAPRTEAGRDLRTNLAKVAESDSWLWWAEQGILAIEAEASRSAPLAAVTDVYAPILKALTYPCHEPIHQHAAEALALIPAQPSATPAGPRRSRISRASGG